MIMISFKVKPLPAFVLNTLLMGLKTLISIRVLASSKGLASESAHEPLTLPSDRMCQPSLLTQVTPILGIILQNKSKGRRGSIVAIIAGTKAETVIEVLGKIPVRPRKKVTEITLDMAGNMALIAKRCFPCATQVTDRFHVQKLASEALQEIRIKHRWQAIEAENEAIEQAKATQTEYRPEVLSNGDTVKQLLARSRYVLYKKAKDWTESQKQRAELLFERYADLKKAYELTMSLSHIFENTTDKLYGLA